MYKAIIFDLDGVIVHTDKFHYLAWKSVADQLGIYFDELINNRLRGVSRMESLDIILERSSRSFNEEEKLEIATKKNNIYRNYLMKMTKDDVRKEVRDVIYKIKEHGIKIAIGSSSKNTKTILKQVEMYNVFDVISDGTNIVNTKPNSEVFEYAANKLNLKSKECLVVEDAVAGINAAINGGFDSFAVGDVASSLYLFSNDGLIPTQGNKTRALLDIRPIAKEAYDLAIQRGYLGETKFSELYIGGMNFGYEVPGTYNISSDIESINVFCK